jgi:hypothetical protein
VKKESKENDFKNGAQGVKENIKNVLLRLLSSLGSLFLKKTSSLNSLDLHRLKHPELLKPPLTPESSSCSPK